MTTTVQNVAISDIAFLAAPLFFGLGVTSLLTPKKYRQCGATPRLQPPGWAFGVAWTILYCLLGAAMMIAWRHCGRKLSWDSTMLLFIGSVAAMMVWWIVFANWCAPKTAFATIVAVLGLIAASALLLWKDGAIAASLLTLPLVAWLAFASYLCFASIPCER
jgi:tryptophan-rich sensory protein